jgi:DNA-binding NarL/FixJ family response regulator
MTKTRILLIEDNRIIRDGIRALVNKHDDISVVAVSDGTGDYIARARSVHPNVLLVDFSLNNQSSLTIVSSVKKEFPEIKIIGMGLTPLQTDIVEFVQAGASGFVLKNSTTDEMLRTIRAVANGETMLPPVMATSLFAQVAERALSKGKRYLKGEVRMTHREKEIIALIAEGLSNKEIAIALNIATFTVKSHVHNILEKLALHSRLQIALHARPDKPLL